MVDVRISAIVVFAALSVANCQTVVLSPCPNVFKYELPGSEPGRWYGVVTLSTDITLHGLWLNIVLDGKADILGNWVGEVTTTDNMDFKIENTTLKIHPGPAQTVRFFIQYNQLGKVPRLTAIRLNGREICSSNNPLPAADRQTYSSANDYTVRPVEETRPVRPSTEDKPNRQSDERPVYVATESPGQRNVNPSSIFGGGVNNQDVGSQSDKGRPGTASSSTQTRPIYDQNRSSVDQSRPSVDQNRPSIDQNRPSVDQSRPNGDQSRPSGDQSRPSYEQSRPSYEQTRPSVDQNRDQNRDQIRDQNRDQIRDQNRDQIRDQNIRDQNRQTITQRPTNTQKRPRPGQSGGDVNFPDYSEDTNSGSADVEYFAGGLPTPDRTTTKRPGRPSANNNQCGKVARTVNPLIVNGRPTTEGQWPWQIALYQTQTVDSKYICGGTLVSRNYVVTAAHCVTRKGSSRVVYKNTLTIYLGKHNLRTTIEGVQIKFVDDIIVHPAYNASSYSRDVGVLRMLQAADFTDTVRPICLWPENQVELSYVIGKRGSVVGWGFDDKGLATEELTLVEMPVVEQETCIRSYSDFFARFTSEYTYCAGFRDGTSVCNGDSGGGMVLKMDDAWYLRGLVSLSVARQNEYRCDPTHYVVFTDLAKFLPWLKQVISSDF